MTETIIRAASIEDLHRLLELEQNIVESERPYDSFLKEEDVSYYDIPNLITSAQSHLIVVESGIDIIGSGYAQIRQSKSYHIHENHCYLGFIYLEPTYRGNSIGRSIVEALKEWGLAKGLRHFHLNVYSDNTSAIRAYEKAGFKKVSVLMELVE